MSDTMKMIIEKLQENNNEMKVKADALADVLEKFNKFTVGNLPIFTKGEISMTTVNKLCDISIEASTALKAYRGK